MSNYCEVILTTDELCDPGLKCCSSINSLDDKNASNIVIPSKKTDTTKKEVKTTQRPSYTTTVTESFMKTTLSTLPKNKCAGDCINGFLALFCDDIDTNADCPEESSCCITNPVSDDVLYFITISNIRYKTISRKLNDMK